MKEVVEKFHFLQTKKRELTELPIKLHYRCWQSKIQKQLVLDEQPQLESQFVLLVLYS